MIYDDMPHHTFGGQETRYLLISKSRLSCYSPHLSSGPRKRGSLQAEGADTAPRHPFATLNQEATENFQGKKVRAEAHSEKRPSPRLT